MPRKPKVKYDGAPVEATVHKSDHRVNTPTAERTTDGGVTVYEG